MNPEMTLVEPSEELKAPTARTLEELSHLSVHDVRTMNANELERLHDELVPHLSKSGQPSGGFSEYAEKLPPLKQKQLVNPAIRAEYLRGYLEGRLATIRSRQHINTQHQQEQTRVATIQARSERENRFLEAADRRIEGTFADWNESREVVDTKGRPQSLYPDDQVFVTAIDRQRKAERDNLDEFFDLTDRYEVGFAQGLDRFRVFGDDAEVVIQPSSKYDDYARGIDMIVRIRPQGDDDKEIVLGIDFTITSSDLEVAKKLRRNLRHPLRSTKYSTREIPKGLNYLPVVLAVDRRRAERITRHEAFIETAKTTKGGEALVQSSTESVANYHDQAVFQYAILEEAIAQLHVQQEGLAERGMNEATQGQYNTAITHLESILEQRKNLQPLSGLETMQEKAVYRVADEDFIRSARESADVDVASPVA